MASEPTNQDLIDAMSTLQESIEILNGSITTLNDSVGDLFNAFDPDLGETRQQLLDALGALTSALESKTAS